MGLCRYGAILSMNSISEILAAIVFGAWADRRPFKEPTLSMYVLALVNYAVDCY